MYAITKEFLLAITRTLLNTDWYTRRICIPDLPWNPKKMHAISDSHVCQVIIMSANYLIELN